MPVVLRACLLAAFLLLDSTGARSASIKSTEGLWGDKQSEHHPTVREGGDDGPTCGSQPPPPPPGDHHPGLSCSRWNERKSWNVLTNEEKKAYIDAELCLIDSPPRGHTPDARSRFEELQYLHILQVPYIHFVGAFLPWHRYFVRVHEQLLQDECGYQGAQPYWDELGDQANFPNIPVFDPDTGFGGNGDGASDCVQDGPFKDIPLHFGPGGSEEYCLSRRFDQSMFEKSDPERLVNCTSHTTFDDAWPCFEAYPHVGGHGGTGGVMRNVSTSPGDPLFFLHHAYLDKVYWDWQQKDPAVRLMEIGGPRLPSARSVALGDMNRFPASAYTEYDGDPGNETTLHHNLWMNGIAPNITIGDVMDLNTGVSCAEYV